MRIYLFYLLFKKKNFVIMILTNDILCLELI